MELLHNNIVTTVMSCMSLDTQDLKSIQGKSLHVVISY